ncbi:MAG: hypothetical protein IJ055_04380 [Oscillospiraceae bacterium]|nr:hypothetical protein [Oscillospiraceae bacterium]
MPDPARPFDVPALLLVGTGMLSVCYTLCEDGSGRVYLILDRCIRGGEPEVLPFSDGTCTVTDLSDGIQTVTAVWGLIEVSQDGRKSS